MGLPEFYSNIQTIVKLVKIVASKKKSLPLCWFSLAYI